MLSERYASVKFKEVAMSPETLTMSGRHILATIARQVLLPLPACQRGNQVTRLNFRESI